MAMKSGEKKNLRDDQEEEYHRTWQFRCGAEERNNSR